MDTHDEVAGEDDKLLNSGRGAAAIRNSAKSQTRVKSPVRCRRSQDNGGYAQNKGKSKRSRVIAEVGSVEVGGALRQAQARLLLVGLRVQQVLHLLLGRYELTLRLL